MDVCHALVSVSQVTMLRAWDSLLAEIRASLPQRNKTQRVLWNCIMNDVFPRDRKVVVAAVPCLKLQRITIRSSEDLCLRFTSSSALKTAAIAKLMTFS
jgi:hypothetical protein